MRRAQRVRPADPYPFAPPRAAPFPKVACARLPSLKTCRAVRIVRGGVPGFETVGGSVETAGRENT